MDIEYFEMETRNGFVVPSFIKYGWASMLKILSVIDRICKDHDIKYFACWGTLLGAVRHGGFVPWDDDMDLCMFRSDYENFLQICKTELPDYMAMYNVYNDVGHGNCITTIFNNKDNNISEELAEIHNGFSVRIGIDIMAIDFLPENKRELLEFGEAVDFISTLLVKYRELSEYEKVNQLNQVYNALGKRIKKADDTSVIKNLGLLLEDICKSYCNSPTGSITHLMSWQHSRNRVMKTEWYEALIDMDFEGIKIPVPIGYDNILKKEYGDDYMTPSKKGTAHNYPYFLNNFISAFENAGHRWYAPESMPIPRQKNERQIRNSKRWQEYIQLAEKLTDSLKSIRDQEEVDRVKNEIIQLSGRMSQEIMAEESRKQEVLFVVAQLKYWNNVEVYFKKELLISNTKVSVLVAPYYRKYFSGDKREFYNETEQFREQEELKEYLIKEETFTEKMYYDRIYTQMPWDEFDMTMELDEKYFCRNLRNKTDMLILLPYLLPDVFSEEDNRAGFTFQFLCRQPGFVEADRVIAGKLKDLYLQKLVEFTGDDTREVWEEKLVDEL